MHRDVRRRRRVSLSPHRYCGLHRLRSLRAGLPGAPTGGAAHPDGRLRRQEPRRADPHGELLGRRLHALGRADHPRGRRRVRRAVRRGVGGRARQHRDHRGTRRLPRQQICTKPHRHELRPGRGVPQAGTAGALHGHPVSDRGSEPLPATQLRQPADRRRRLPRRTEPAGVAALPRRNRRGGDLAHLDAGQIDRMGRLQHPHRRERAECDLRTRRPKRLYARISGRPIPPAHLPRLPGEERPQRQRSDARRFLGHRGLRARNRGRQGHHVADGQHSPLRFVRRSGTPRSASPHLCAGDRPQSGDPRIGPAAETTASVLERGRPGRRYRGSDRTDARCHASLSGRKSLSVTPIPNR